MTATNHETVDACAKEVHAGASLPWWITGPMPKIERWSVETAFIAPALPARVWSSVPACSTQSPAPP